MAENQQTMPEPDGPDEDRRKFLAACGKFAVVTPPAVTLLLSTSMTSEAIAQSGGVPQGGGSGGGGPVQDCFTLLQKLFGG